MGGVCSGKGLQSNFRSKYILKKLLGKGHFASVFVCEEIGTGNSYAVKIIEKERLADRSIVDAEIDILRRLDGHPNIMQLHDVKEDETSLYLVTELCSGGDLFQRIADWGNLDEPLAAKWLKNIAKALIFLHGKGVTHRDLKPENILLTSGKNDTTDMKLADFGLSKIIDGEEGVMDTICGTWAYCAPEIIENKAYTTKVDNWTVGVLLYIMVAGYHPFDIYGEKPQAELLRDIKNLNYNFDDEVWDYVSKGAKDLIKALMTYDPEKRMTMDEFINSDWVKSEANVHNQDEEMKRKQREAAQKNLIEFNQKRIGWATTMETLKAAGRFKKKLNRMRSQVQGKSPNAFNSVVAQQKSKSDSHDLSSALGKVIDSTVLTDDASVASGPALQRTHTMKMDFSESKPKPPSDKKPEMKSPRKLQTMDEEYESNSQPNEMIPRPPVVAKPSHGSLRTAKPSSRELLKDEDGNSVHLSRVGKEDARLIPAAESQAVTNDIADERSEHAEPVRPEVPIKKDSDIDLAHLAEPSDGEGGFICS